MLHQNHAGGLAAVAHAALEGDVTFQGAGIA